MTRKQRVLIVAGEPSAGRLAGFLGDPGVADFDSEIAADVAPACGAVDAPDVILLDLESAEDFGAEDWQALDESATPVVLVADGVEETRVLGLIGGGCDDYLVRETLDTSGVVRALRHAVARSRRWAQRQKDHECCDLVVRASVDGVWDWDLTHDTLDFSPRWLEMLGLSGRQVGNTADGWLERVHPDDRARVETERDAHLSGATPVFVSEHRIRHADETYRWVQWRGLAVRCANGKIRRMAGVMRDITDRRTAEEQLRHGAFYDALTGLSNRALLMDRLGRAVEQAKRRGDYQFALLFADLDGFKRINDSLGHAAGDEMLMAVARRMEKCVRTVDTLARVGGDEFAIILHDIGDISDALRVAERIQEFLRTLGFDGMENDRLVDKGMEWREDGLAGHERGKLDEAMESFERSRAAFIELHQREGGTRRALFELGQAEFYVGYVHYDKGELDEAQEHFTRYGAITRRLVNEDPNDAELVMELSYTLTNLSSVESARTDSDTDKALRLTQSAVQYNQIALVLDPGNDVYRKSLNNKLAFLADAWLDSCDLGKAFDFRQQAVVMSRGLYQGSPARDDLKRDLAYSLSGLASVQRQIPMSDQALANLREARDLLIWLAVQDDENPRLRWQALMRQVRILRIRAWAEPLGGLWQEIEAQRQGLETLLLTDGFEESVDYAGFLIDYSRLAWRLDKPVKADQALGEAMDRLSGLVSENPEHRISLHLLANAWFEHWNRHGALPSDQAAAMLESYLVDPERATSCDDDSLAARLELMRGNIPLAKDYTLYLLGKGFYEPGFVAFCKRNGLCEM